VLALPTEEPQRIVPVRGARAELAWLQGHPDQARAEAEAALGLVSGSDGFLDWEILRYQQWRAEGGLSGPHPTSAAGLSARGPHGAHMRGEWRAAAAAWERIGCPYERPKRWQTATSLRWRKHCRRSLHWGPHQPRIACVRLRAWA
jgi:hypothetical protein